MGLNRLQISAFFKPSTRVQTSSSVYSAGMEACVASWGVLTVPDAGGVCAVHVIGERGDKSGSTGMIVFRKN